MTRAVAILTWLLISASAAAVGPATVHYFDEATNRHAVVREEDFGKVSVVIRTVYAPGAFSRWLGDGQRKDKEITFAQTVGEDQERGTYFLAKATESKLEITYKPGQRMPVDAGINGTYRHISDEKRLSLSKRESASADDALTQALRTAPKLWPGVSRSVAGEWKDRWPDLRSRWMSLVFRPPSPPPSTPAKIAPVGAKGGNAGAPVPSADYWIALAETTGMAIGFINQPLDKAIPLEWDGEYDDGFGGHVSLRLGRDGFLRFTLSCTRGGGEGQTGDLFGRVPAAALTKDKNGDLVASYTHSDAALKPEDQQATVKLRKTGHFLFVDTQYAERYCGRAWFDGIYRWGPVPKE
jgi:hypothetical protein